MSKYPSPLLIQHSSRSNLISLRRIERLIIQDDDISYFVTFGEEDFFAILHCKRCEQRQILPVYTQARINVARTMRPLIKHIYGIQYV